MGTQRLNPEASAWGRDEAFINWIQVEQLEILEKLKLVGSPKCLTLSYWLVGRSVKTFAGVIQRWHGALIKPTCAERISNHSCSSTNTVFC